MLVDMPRPPASGKGLTRGLEPAPDLTRGEGDSRRFNHAHATREDPATSPAPLSPVLSAVIIAHENRAAPAIADGQE